MPKDDVVIGYMYNTDTSGHFTRSLANLVHWDGRHDQRILDLISLSTGPRMAEARNSVVDIFAAKHPEAEWLWMTDTDMVFDPPTLDALLSVAHPTQAPIVGGLCFAGGRSSHPYPTVYRGVEKDGYANIERVYDYPKNEMVKVQATGGACMLMHRDALGAMKNHYSKGSKANEVYPLFAEGVVGPEGEPWGEDTVFCLRANAIGIPVYVHTGIKIGHVKTQVIDEVFYDNYMRSAVLTAEGLYEQEAPPNRAERRRKAREVSRLFARGDAEAIFKRPNEKAET